MEGQHSGSREDGFVVGRFSDRRQVVVNCSSRVATKPMDLVRLTLGAKRIGDPTFRSCLRHLYLQTAAHLKTSWNAVYSLVLLIAKGLRILGFACVGGPESLPPSPVCARGTLR